MPTTTPEQPRAPANVGGRHYAGSVIPDKNEALTPALGTRDVTVCKRDNGTPARKVLLTDETVC